MNLFKRKSEPNNYVSLVLDGKVRVQQVTSDMQNFLIDLGAKEETIRGEICWVIDVSGDENLGNLLGKLRDKGFLFSVDQGWSPSSIFKKLREHEFVDGEYNEVAWRGFGRWFITKK
jgi:hypothetical protein